MMEKKPSKEIVIIFLAIIIIGIHNLMGGQLFYTVSNFLSRIFLPGWAHVTIKLLYSLIFVGFVVGGIALLFLKRWGKNLAQRCISLDVIMRLFGIVNYLIWCFSEANLTTEQLNMEQYARGCLATMPTHVSSIYPYIISMIPTYIIFLVELLILFCLTRPKVKEQFR